MGKWVCFFIFCFAFLAKGFTAEITNELDPLQLVNNGFLHSDSYRCLKELKLKNTAQYNFLIDKLFYLDNHFESYAKTAEALPKNATPKIPPTVHLIWLGPKPFPDLSVFYRWHEKNPDYTIVLWTDNRRPINCPFLEFRYIDSLFPLRLQKEFDATSNFGEKSDILRLEILERFGGIYADTDVLCYRSFDTLIHHFNFFCGLESVYPLTRDVFLKVSNCLIGAAPHQRIIRQAIDNIQENWEKNTNSIVKYWVGFPPHSMYDLSKQLVLWRTFLPFTDAVFASPLTPEEAVVPHYYFGLSSRHFANYALHLFNATWIEDAGKDKESTFNARSQKAIKKLYKNSILIATCSLVSFLFSSFALYVLLKTRRKKHLA